MLCHEALERATQVARHWSDHGCPIVIHLDARVPKRDADAFEASLSDRPNIRFSRRYPCDWGRWSLVRATQEAATLLLQAFPDVSHVFLASGACLPLRPVEEMRDYLAERPGTDFIESATTEDVPWTKGGLDYERFTLRFPFSWRKNRRLFDAYVRLQRRVGYRRRIPEGMVPHMGSQWWCLTRATLAAILNHPRRAEFDRYFQRVWIPDESYFQTLVRLVSANVESRSLTLSKFDFQGKPHVFYDDHLQLLRRSDCFVARKIWPRADRLYATFLSGHADAMSAAEPNPGKIDRIFSKAIERRIEGRPGLYMTGRFPRIQRDSALTCARYTVFEGFGDLFPEFQDWLRRTTGLRAHGHLYAPDRAEFAEDQTIFTGALSDSATLRDYNPKAFLTSLIWNTRGERQAFLYGSRDTVPIGSFIASDPNAEIMVISGAWAIPLMRAQMAFPDIRKEAARLQRIENEHLMELRSGHTKARVQIWTLADFVESPAEPLQGIVDDVAVRRTGPMTEMPRMADLTGFGQFLQNLRNEGMHPYLMGDFPSGAALRREDAPAKPYIARENR
ncbi:Core-2/I-Branching enzyme [Rhodobacteraceae bacterium THAF1]|nr:Core-2/I-Branching enzyme [Rhodobacteraceae bacterium THAF1]